MSLDATFLIALAAADRRLRVPQGQYLRAGRARSIRQDAESLRERGFTIFSTAINIGAVLGPLGDRQRRR